MNLLAIETATEACSAALCIDGDTREKYQLAPRQHADLILQMIDDLLRDAGINKRSLDAVAFGRGPGSFTGIRIAAGVTQGIAFALGIPVIPISTLAAVAQQHADQRARVAVAMDARMNQVYWGTFQRNTNGLMQIVGNEMVCAPDRITVPDNDDWLGAGSGWNTHHVTLSRLFGEKLSGHEPLNFPRATAIIALAIPAYANAEYLAADKARPVYIRNNAL